MTKTSRTSKSEQNRRGEAQPPPVEIAPSGQYPKTPLSIEISQSLTDQQLLFASLVAGGETYKAAATEAGFHPLYGFKLMQMPQVRQRVEELLREPTERTRAHVDAEFSRLLRRVSAGELTPDQREDCKLLLQVLLGMAKYHGYIIDRKEVKKATLNLKMPAAELKEVFLQQLNQLAPGERARIEAIAAGEDELEGAM